MTSEPIPVVLSEDFSADAIHTLYEEGQEACLQQFPELEDHSMLLDDIARAEESISYCQGKVDGLKGKADTLDLSAEAHHTLCQEGTEACIQLFPELKDHPELLKETLQIEDAIDYFEGRISTIKEEADALGLKLKQILAAAPEASR